MKNKAIPIAVSLLVLLLGLYLITFQVRETEVVFVERLGKVVDKQYDPGFHFGWPAPIDRIHRYDSRMRVFEGQFVETNTKGLVPIIVKPYVVWRIEDAYKFYKSQKAEKEAESKLFGLINNSLNEVIGTHSFGDLVNSDPGRIQLAAIQDEMLAALKDASEEEYGLKIETFGIKQLKVNEDVTAKVFDRMKAARNLQTEAITSKGAAEAKAIRTEADRINQVLLSAAQARALEIKGQGDADAAQYYALLEEEPEFAIFLRNLEVLPMLLGENSTYVVPTDADPFKLLKEKPTLGK